MEHSTVDIFHALEQYESRRPGRIEVIMSGLGSMLENVHQLHQRSTWDLLIQGFDDDISYLGYLYEPVADLANRTDQLSGILHRMDLILMSLPNPEDFLLYSSARNYFHNNVNRFIDDFTSFLKVISKHKGTKLQA